MLGDNRSKVNQTVGDKNESDDCCRVIKKNKRISGFNMALGGTALVPIAYHIGQVTGATPAVPGMFSHALQHPTLCHGTRHETRHARCVYVGGLSCTANEQTVATFFNQAMSAIGGNSAGPGNAVVHVYIKRKKKFALVRRANQSAVQPRPEQESLLEHVRQQVAYQTLLCQPESPPTKIVCITQAVNADELKNDKEYEYILEDMREEGGKYGKLTSVVVPRPGPNGEPTPGLGKVFLEYADNDGSGNARQRLNGRICGGRKVAATFYSEDKFARGEYGS